VVKTRRSNHRCVFIWFASWWRNHQFTLGKENQDFTLGLITAILSFCDIFSVRIQESNLSRACSSISQLVQDKGVASLVESFKYCTSKNLSYLYCSNEHLEPPLDLLDLWKLLGINRHMKRRSNGSSKRRLFFIHSLHLLKRNCPPLPATLVAAAVEKHQLALSQERQSPIECKEFVSIYTQDLLKNFSSKCNLFSPLSRNSCVERSRSRGGAQGVCSQNVTQVVKSTSGILELRRIAIINSFAETSAQRFHDMSTFRLTDEPKQLVKVRCVDDPLKARIITVEPVINQRLKQVTTDLNRYLGQYEQFRLIRGESVKSLITCLPPLKAGHKYVSGDYSAATDNLNADICRTCAEIVSEHIPEDLKSLYLDNASMHRIEYPSGALMEQKNGQLMGSLSSFNNLSIINSALFSHVRSYNPDSFSDWHFVNGDDILFTATPEGLATWKDVTKACGLSPSFGKNYYSKDYFTINSQFFKDRVEIPFVNFRLLKPLGDDKREHVIDLKGRNRSVVLPTALGAAWRDVCARAQIGLDDKSRIRRSFLRAHTKDLLRIGKDLLLPSAWGGCGAMTIKDALRVLPLNLNSIRDIAHKTKGHASDLIAEIGLAIGKTLDLLPPDDRTETSRITSRAQFIFSGDKHGDTPKTRSPCRHCLSLRYLVNKPITPALVSVIRGQHTH
jgi:hypothetical protein